MGLMQNSQHTVYKLLLTVQMNVTALEKILILSGEYVRGMWSSSLTVERDSGKSLLSALSDVQEYSE